MRALTRNSLLNILAHFGSLYWAGNLQGILEDGTIRSEIDAWPLSPALPSVRVPPVKPVPPGGSAPDLSIMLPVFDIRRDDWLCSCLEAVLEQDQGPAWGEIVLVDDASPNDRAERIASRLGNRIRYLRNEKNLGLVANHNRCLNLARGRFVHILHQDDRIEPGFYSTLMPPLLDDQNRLLAAFSSFRYIDGDGRVCGQPEAERKEPGTLSGWLERLVREQRIQFPAMIIRRSAFVELGGFSPSFCFAFDWEMWGRIARSGAIWYDPQPLASYRIHELSVTGGLSPLARLIDEMRTAACLWEMLAPPRSADTLRAALKKPLLDAWRMLASGRPGDHSDTLKPLIQFLLDGWAGPREREEVLEGLGLRHPGTGPAPTRPPVQPS